MERIKMNKVIKELIISSYQDLGMLYAQERQLKQDLEKSRKRNSVVMSIESLLGGRKEGSVGVLSEKLRATEDKIDGYLTDFKESVKGILSKVDTGTELFRANLVDKIGFLDEQRNQIGVLQDEIRFLKNDLKAYLKVPEIGDNPYTLYQRVVGISEKVASFEFKSALQTTPSPEEMRQYLINVSRELGGRVVQINHMQNGFDEQLVQVNQRIDHAIEAAQTDLINRAQKKPEQSLSMSI